MGSVALVTGAGTGLGRVVAEVFLARGASVVAHYHTSQEGVVQLACKAPDKVRPVRADLARVEEIRSLVEAAHSWAGRVDILVNSAATLVRTPVDSLDPQEWDAVMAVNLRAPALLASWVGTAMRERGSGVIVNVGDVAGMEPWPAYLAHATSKAALHHFTRCLALALAPSVRVNAVAPGLVSPPPGWTQERVERFRRRISLGRLPSAQEVAGAVVWLVENDAVTGQVVVVDGGQSLSF